MACNLDVITCNYMHYMSLHATEDANVTYDGVTYDVVGPTMSQVHDVVGMTDIVGPDLRYRMF